MYDFKMTLKSLANNKINDVFANYVGYTNISKLPSFNFSSMHDYILLNGLNNNYICKQHTFKIYFNTNK